MCSSDLSELNFFCTRSRSREPWTVENGLLTPTLKVKRERVQKKFSAEIERAYAAGALD